MYLNKKGRLKFQPSSYLSEMNVYKCGQKNKNMIQVLNRKNYSNIIIKSYMKNNMINKNIKQCIRLTFEHIRKYFIFMTILYE